MKRTDSNRIPIFCAAVSLFLVAGSAHAASHAVAVFLDPGQTHPAALRALKQFPEVLTEDDTARCLRFLSARFDPTKRPRLIVRQNDLADRLLQKPDTLAQTTETLLRVLADEAVDPLWREYCLQKLPVAYEQASISEELRADLLVALRFRSADHRTSFSGTALLGLYRLREAAGIPDEELIAHARQILDHPGYATANRVTALQIAALLGDPYAMRQARALVDDPAAPVQLRISAIASVGQRGGADDARLLETLTRHPDIRIRTSSRNALSQLPTP